jgi:hypothetical protein
MKKCGILLSLLLLASCILFVSRRQSLRELKTEQVQLQNQLKPNVAASVPPVEDAPTNAVPGRLSAEEHSELLRLRGQISGLRQDLIQESNQLAAVSRTRRTAPASEPTGEGHTTPAEAVQKLTAGRQWGVALIMYADSHDGQLPAAIADAAAFAGVAATNEDLELVRNGPLYSGTNQPARTIVLRDKKPWQGPGGRWCRTYVFADGHSEIARSDTSDFSEWEEKLKTR